jgi:hypothetical protein
MLYISKYNGFLVKRVLGLVIITILLSSCVNQKSLSIPLSDNYEGDIRFIDTLSIQTKFTLGIFNFNGYDKFASPIHEQLRFRLKSQASLEKSNINFVYFKGYEKRQGLRTIYKVEGYYIKEPNLTVKDTSLDVLTIGQISTLNKSKVNDTAVSVKFSIPESVVSILELNKKKSTSAEKLSRDRRIPPEDAVLKSKIIIVACYTPENFARNKVDIFKTYNNNPYPIDFYETPDWIRVYALDVSKDRLFEVRRYYPEAWIVKFGE